MSQGQEQGGDSVQSGKTMSCRGREQMLPVTLASEASAASEMRTENIPR